MTKPKKTKELTKFLNKVDKAAVELSNFIDNDFIPQSYDVSRQDIKDAYQYALKIEGITGQIAQLLHEVR